MLYSFDLRKIIQRYVPTWFRWPENLSLAYAYCRWLLSINDSGFVPLRAEVTAEYRYNGLLHSLGIALNDHFDQVDRRIWIDIQDQLPYLYYRSAGEIPTVRFGDAGSPASNYFMDAATLHTALQYPFEFTINVPDVLGISPSAIFDYADLYRLAGRRPRVIIRGPFNAIYGIYNYEDYG